MSNTPNELDRSGFDKILKDAITCALRDEYTDKITIFVDINKDKEVPMKKVNDNRRSIATLSPSERSARQSTISKRVTSSKEEATKFLQKAGILTRNGNVSPRYKNA